MKGARVNLYLPVNLANSLKKLAQEDGRSVNQYVTLVLQRHVQKHSSQISVQEARTAEIPIHFG